MPLWHEQCLQKNLSLGVRLRMAETKSTFTAVASSWGNNYLGGGKGRAISSPLEKQYVCQPLN